MNTIKKYIEISQADVKYLRDLAKDIEYKYKVKLLNIIREEMKKDDKIQWWGDLRWGDSKKTYIQYVTSLDERGRYYNELEIPLDVLEWELKYTFHIELVDDTPPSLIKYQNYE